MRVRILLAVLTIAAVAAGFKFVAVKQELTQQRAEIDEQWANVEAAMQKRADSVPHLLDPVRDSQFDPRQFDAAAKRLASATSPQEKIRANREISLVLAKLLLACETDPRLRQSGGFQRVREELAAREDEIANARFQYNNALEHYNARMLRFPVNVVASLAGFSRNDAYFGTGPDAALAPKAPN
jgi:LemA protein